MTFQGAKCDRVRNILTGEIACQMLSAMAINMVGQKTEAGGACSDSVLRKGFTGKDNIWTKI